MDNESTSQTKGQQIVRTSFDPSQDNKIDTFKQMCANLIDYINKHGGDSRLENECFTSIEIACMYGVKALTV
jgi:hypothetical protein